MIVYEKEANSTIFYLHKKSISIPRYRKIGIRSSFLQFFSFHSHFRHLSIRFKRKTHLYLDIVSTFYFPSVLCKETRKNLRHLQISRKIFNEITGRIVSSGATTGRIQWSIATLLAAICSSYLVKSSLLLCDELRQLNNSALSFRDFGHKFSQVPPLTLAPSALLDLKNRARARKYLQFFFFGAQTKFFFSCFLERKKEDILSGIVDHTVLEREAKMRKPFYNHPVGRALFFQRYSFFLSSFLLSLQELTPVTLSFGSLCFTLYFLGV